MTALAWHNNPDLKQEVMARLRDHRAADDLVKGVYQAYAPDTAAGYRGCAADDDAAARTWQAERLIHHLATAPIGVPA